MPRLRVAAFFAIVYMKLWQPRLAVVGITSARLAFVRGLRQLQRSVGGVCETVRCDASQAQTRVWTVHLGRSLDSVSVRG